MKKQYIPTAVRGVSYQGHIRINRSQLAKLFRNPDFTFHGFIVGNKVNTFHFFGGWHLACTLTNKTEQEMKEALNGFEYYLDAELGSQAAIFLSRVCVPSEKRVLASCDAVYSNDNH